MLLFVKLSIKLSLGEEKVKRYIAKEITNGELLAYINDNVSSKALEQGRKQNPELLSEKNKILIKY